MMMFRAASDRIEPSAVTLDPAGPGEPAESPDALHAGPLQQEPHPGGQLADDPAVAALQPFPVERRLGGGDAEGLRRADVVEQRGRMEEHLARDAPDMEAGPAESRVLFDDRGPEAGAGRPEGGHVPARAAADDHHLEGAARGFGHGISGSNDGMLCLESRFPGATIASAVLRSSPEGSGLRLPYASPARCGFARARAAAGTDPGA